MVRELGGRDVPSEHPLAHFEVALVAATACTAAAASTVVKKGVDLQGPALGVKKARLPEPRLLCGRVADVVALGRARQVGGW